ncbi:unnamed protein product [Diamesa serratosioi]
MSGAQIIKQLHRNSFFGKSFLNNLWKTTTIQRQITTEEQPRKKPKCLYIQGPIQWAKCKVKFQYLKFVWDWNFSEKNFKEGTKQEAFKMINLIRTADIDSLSKVTTKNGFKQLSRDVELSKNDPRMSLLYLRAEDISHVVPTDVHLFSKMGHRHCFIDVFFIAMRYLDEIVQCNGTLNDGQNINNFKVYEDIKLVENMLHRRKNVLPPSDVHNYEKLVFAEMFARFHCNYSLQQPEKTEPQWNVDFFKVSEFDILYYKPSDYI